MNSSINSLSGQLIDLSEYNQLNYWAKKLGTKPESIKTAARACCSNAADKIADYLKGYKQNR